MHEALSPCRDGVKLSGQKMRQAKPLGRWRENAIDRGASLVPYPSALDVPPGHRAFHSDTHPIQEGLHPRLLQAFSPAAPAGGGRTRTSATGRRPVARHGRDGPAMNSTPAATPSRATGRASSRGSSRPGGPGGRSPAKRLAVRPAQVGPLVSRRGAFTVVRFPRTVRPRAEERLRKKTILQKTNWSLSPDVVVQLHVHGRRRQQDSAFSRCTRRSTPPRPAGAWSSTSSRPSRSSSANSSSRAPTRA